MNVRRVVSYGVSALAIATWFASASTSGVRKPLVPLQAEKPSSLDRASATLQSEIGRLHERIGPTAIPSSSRDLFRFNVRAPRRPAAPAPVAAAIDTPPPVPPRPQLKLIGIAEDASDAGPVRTAIVSGLGDVFLLKAGDTFGGHYRVDQVSSDAVAVTDTMTSTSTAFTLR